MKRNSSSNRPTPNTPATTPNAAPGAETKTPHYSSKDPGKIDDLVKAAHLQVSDQKTSAATTSPQPQSSAAPGNTQAKADGNDSKRRVAFQFKRPAGSVKVAGDFTHWDQSPVEMIAAGEGQWSAIIQLPPGEYSYRFIVDGQWCEDPLCSRHAPNGFGSQNSVVVVR